MIDYPHLGDSKIAYVKCGLRVYEVRCHRRADGIWTFLARDGRHLHPDPKNVYRSELAVPGSRKSIYLRQEERRAWGLPWVDGEWKVHPAMTTQEKRWLMMTGKPMTPSLPVFTARIDALRKLAVLAGEAERAASQADKITAHACLFKAMVLREACDALRVAWEESDRAEREDRKDRLDRLRSIRDSAARTLCVLLESELKEARARILTLENALNAANERALRLKDQLTGMGA